MFSSDVICLKTPGTVLLAPGYPAEDKLDSNVIIEIFDTQKG